MASVDVNNSMSAVKAARPGRLLAKTALLNISNCGRVVVGLMLWIMALGPASAHAEIITRLPGEDKVVALTFDACETVTPSSFDRTILDYLVQERIPFTVFVSGKFAQRNAEAIRRLSENELIEFENHSFRHVQHMERMSWQDAERDIVACAKTIAELTGRPPVFFRFPAGNSDARTVNGVERLGYRIVHWTFASGDPDRNISPARLSRFVLDKTRPASILIFHINGRGYSTGEALPRIVEELRRRGYRFTLLKTLLAE